MPSTLALLLTSSATPSPRMLPRRRLSSPLLHGLLAVLLWLAQLGWVAHAAEHLRGEPPDGVAVTHLCAVCLAADHAVAPPVIPPTIAALPLHPPLAAAPRLPVPLLAVYGRPSPRGPPRA
jgi:hypothetical protein